MSATDVLRSAFFSVVSVNDGSETPGENSSYFLPHPHVITVAPTSLFARDNVLCA